MLEPPELSAEEVKRANERIKGYGGQLALDLALMDDVPPIGVDSREILRNVARVCELYLEAKEGG